ncbi:glycogen debranching protein GlgX [Porphyrobacter sp. AAP60]|uniref:glycogen debranching protein GlgX n=1 Tax=Porphyrobacter sp. AAP60 TaxID=1523423 RepID=UPI0006B8C7F5|nr:glycogen debranching protein GlgX [Porphyrobacter sp. AAP60]KPF64970.1 glycogen debranching protein [Porphyrobacter sp. AAP60]
MDVVLGSFVGESTTRFAVRAPLAEAVDLCLFDGEAETRHAMTRAGEVWVAEVAGDLTGTRYAYRAHGSYTPEANLWFDPAKLLVDPYAVELDRRFVQHPRLAQFGEDTADIVPRAVVQGGLPVVPHQAPLFQRGGLIYEINVAGFTALHPDVPARQRGTIAALAHPAVIAHLKKLHVSAVELMPIVAWLDERHLPPLGLANHWGYNPVAMMALDPGLCPGGGAELREAVAALHDAGIGVILDLVFNHSGESDVHGGTLSLRGLDPAAYACAPDGALINDTGCGNTLDFANPHVRRLMIDSLVYFVRHCGIDGFRFDLATVIARGPGFDAQAPIFAELAAEPLLADRVMIAEPWDIGPGGYQLGRFPPNWLEWNDKYRDDVRRFWKGTGTVGDLATRIAGSSDIFGSDCRSINFLAAHDGFTLADTVAYEHRQNHANGEDNRDGHGTNHSWNCGAEGPSDDPAILARRAADIRAMLRTLFASTGTIMMTAGDECGRSQHGNNNAYCQHMPIDWAGRDQALEDFTAQTAAARAANLAAFTQFPEGGQWLGPDGAALDPDTWQDPATDGFTYLPPEGSSRPPLRISRAMRTIG